MPPLLDEARIGNSTADLKQAILDNLYFIQGRIPEIATPNDWYMALAYTVRDRMMAQWTYAITLLRKADIKTVSYLSAEFLIGPQLANNLLNLGIRVPVTEALRELGLDLESLIAQEPEPGLGNGGLGRLAACYMDSLATLRVPAIGYGIRYEFGLFRQEIRDGWQVEKTDKWLHFGNPWEICRPEISYKVGEGGRTEWYHDEGGNLRVHWIPAKVVLGIAHDTLIAGYHGVVDILRLWASEAVDEFDLEAFNIGDYDRAVEEKVASETISKVLYPNDQPEAGKRLRLAQQYFFTSCSLQDMMRIQQLRGESIETLHESFAVQMNDTHPSIAVAELMRLLVDEHHMDWDKAWDVTQKTLAYTNHTLLPEALEKWPLPLFASMLPRHLEIIYEINRRFLDEVRSRYPGDNDKISRMSLIDENDQKYVRMAYLATVGSHAVNGVAELHSELLKKTVMHDFYELWPQKFLNVTNGVTPRRWVALSNPELSQLICNKVGGEWLTHEEELRKLEPFARDASFCSTWWNMKQTRKRALAAWINERTGATIDPATLFDVQVKRIHEYKRQLLNILYVISQYNEIRRNPGIDVVPRTLIVGGKSAPGYFMAKLIIKLINSVAEVIDRDPAVGGRLKVVFFPDFNVTNGQMIYPAADLSEQISTAGKEASGTGNMKFAMNGALTIGTLDGANVEIRQQVGEENFFLFGLTVEQVFELRRSGYDPRRYYEANPVLKETLDQIASGVFSPGNRDLFRPIVDSLLTQDAYMLLADFQAYRECQSKVDQAYRDREQWTRMSILNVARMGKFSSDRSIREYCQNIWNAKPIDAAFHVASVALANEMLAGRHV
ncbi:MAG: glycogen/starch/alpha-glucan phosphorylase [Acidobacteriaceae bacterium]|nr:glycogen/starch/alpha-glucan phosphorylase [Acidobacteriaceae bacterium]MBV8571968.1 glycogen/starch/alpha-glucan phosphorylase [Acidobacteriaceae bacterium]